MGNKLLFSVAFLAVLIVLKQQQSLKKMFFALVVTDKKH